MSTPLELEIEEFSSAAKWRSWLTKKHKSSEGIWLRIHKKNSPHKSVSYAEALDEALCFGWIDSQKKAYDEVSYLQKFSPRRDKSIWSKVNVGHIERLIAAGKMKAAGLEQVEKAKKDGRWGRAYDSPSSAKIPLEFMKELKKNSKAHDFFQTLNKTNLYAIAWRLQTATSAQIKDRRTKAIIAMLAKGEKFHE